MSDEILEIRKREIIKILDCFDYFNRGKLIDIKKDMGLSKNAISDNFELYRVIEIYPKDRNVKVQALLTNDIFVFSVFDLQMDCEDLLYNNLVNYYRNLVSLN